MNNTAFGSATARLNDQRLQSLISAVETLLNEQDADGFQGLRQISVVGAELNDVMRQCEELKGTIRGAQYDYVGDIMLGVWRNVETNEIEYRHDGKVVAVTRAN